MSCRAKTRVKKIEQAGFSLARMRKCSTIKESHIYQSIQNSSHYMIYSDKYQREPVPATLQIIFLIALCGVILTGGQIIHILLQGGIFCLNEGCEIVEKLTKIPPLYINLAGLLYFSVLSLCLWFGRDGRGKWLKIFKLLLLGGFCAEGVLFSFQLFVSHAYCLYCLLVFASIVLLNLMTGTRVFLTGLVGFLSVVAIFSSLQFTSIRGEISLDEGSMARLGREEGQIRNYLFFSSTCRHCEEVIASLQEKPTSSVRFNPIDVPKTFNVQGAESFPKYQSDVNRSFLKHLDINEIPVLVVREPRKTMILQGKQQIIEYLHGTSSEQTASTETSPSAVSETSSNLPGKFQLPGQANASESCSVDKDCDPVDQKSANRK